MEVILKEDIRSLGKIGDIVKVSDGYARNNLLPQKKAVEASKANLNVLKMQKKSIDSKRAELKAKAEETAVRLKDIKISFERETGEEEKIFGAVTSKQISDFLEEKGFKLDHRDIQLKETIRALGTYTAEVYLHSDVVVPLTVEVTKK